MYEPKRASNAYVRVGGAYFTCVVVIQKVLCQIQWHLFLPHRRGEANYRIIKWLIACLAFISCKLYDHLMFLAVSKMDPI